MSENFLKENNAKHLIHPMAHPKEMINNPPNLFTKADDVYITDIDGNRLLDAVGGLWNANLGYSADTVKQAIFDQLNTLPYTSTFRGQTNDKVIELSKRLIDMTTPENMKGVFFTQGGSDSADTSMRLSLQYWKLKGQPEKKKFLSLKNGYHGTHVGGASLCGSDKFTKAYGLEIQGVIHLNAPWLYRNPWDITDENQLCDKLIAELEATIESEGADTICAMIGEPVIGSGGVIPPMDNYWKRVQDVLNKNNILLIADEVITAFGRTGEIFGCRTYGYKPDIINFAKAVTNGFFPLGGVLVNEEIHTTLTTNDNELGVISTGYTNSGNPTGCAAALATLDLVEKIQPQKNAKDVGAYLKEQLKKKISHHPNVGDIRGKGLMCSIEFVTDKDSKTMDKASAEKVGQGCYARNVWVRVSGPFVILSPSLIITKDHADTIVDAIAQSLDELH